MRNSYPGKTRRVCTASALFALAALLPAQDPPTPSVAPTEAAIQSAIQALQDNQDLDKGIKASAVGIYQEALQLVRSGGGWQTKAAALEAQRVGAPEQIDASKRRLATLALDPVPKHGLEADMVTLEQELGATRVLLEAAEKLANELEQEGTQRGERRVVLPQLIAAARLRLEQAGADVAQPGDPKDAPVVGDAKRARAQSRRWAAAHEVQALERELGSYEVTGDLLSVRRDVAQRNRAWLAKLLSAYQDLVTRKREQEAAAAESKARASMQDTEPALVQLGQENVALAARRAEIARGIQATAQDEARVRAQHAALDDAFHDIQRRLKVAGFTEAIGLQLRRERSKLPDVRTLERTSATRKSEIASRQLEWLDFDDRRTALSDFDERVREVLGTLSATEDENARARVERRAAELLTARRETVEAMVRDLDAHLDALVKLDTAERAFRMRAKELRRFIDERVLWIRSSVPIWRVQGSDAVSALVALAAVGSWQVSVRSLIQVEFLVVALLGLAAVIGLALLRGLLTRRIEAVGASAAKATCLSFVPTVRGVVLTVLLALPPAAAMLTVGLLLQSVTEPYGVGRAVGAALVGAAWIVLALGITRCLVRSGGLADAHFGWPAPVLQQVRRCVALLTVIATPAVLVALALDHFGNESWVATLGRLAFVIAVATLAVAMIRLLHPETGVLAHGRQAEARRFFHRTRHLWWLVGAATPFALGVLSCLGYTYSAEQLGERLLFTLALVLALVLANSLTRRALLIARRRVSVELSRARSAAREAARGSEAQGVSVAAEAGVDVEAVSAQARQLLRAATTLAIVLGAWLIWVDVLPALGVLKQVELWEHTVSTTVAVPNADGSEQIVTSDKIVPITLVDLVLACIVFFLTVLASRGIPGFLSLTLLRRLPIQDGERYAISTVTRYAILFVGIVMGFSAIGIGWSEVQWLAAAMVVGLGFGLQEIFANFVSGLIILFERPVRVGDVVTVGDLTGKVARVRIRATTVLDWDLREIVIPNKEFITARVVNWTLSDPVTRETIRVGVAYGSDTAKARSLLLQAANDNPVVLANPAPSAIFVAFGASSLDFDLRVFIPNRDVWPSVMDALHSRIDEEFRQAGIEIAFPQRDIHLRSADSLKEVFGERRPRTAEEDS